MFQHQLLCALVTHLNIRHLRQEIAVLSDQHWSSTVKKNDERRKIGKKKGGGEKDSLLLQN